MLAQRSPEQAYRSVDFDARVSGSDPYQLVALCYEQLLAALDSALHAHDTGRNEIKSKALTKALASVTALQLGVDGEGGVAAALHHFYEAARRVLLDNVIQFDAVRLAEVRSDFAELAAAMRAKG